MKNGNILSLQDRLSYDIQFANLVDELYRLNPYADHRWKLIKDNLPLYSYESLVRLADDLRHDLTTAWNLKYTLIGGIYIERPKLKKVA